MAEIADSSAVSADKVYGAYRAVHTANAKFILACDAHCGSDPVAGAAANAAGAAHDEALEALLFMPVDSARALGWKLEEYISGDLNRHVRADEFIAVMAADAKRIVRAQEEAERRAKRGAQ